MAELTPSPLTDLERRELAGLLDARTKLARKMTLLFALIDGLFCLRLWGASTYRNRLAMVAIGVVATAAIALILGNFAWRAVLRLQGDLRAGVKQAITGTIRAVVRAPTPDGQTITRVTIGAEELVTKGELFAAAKEGQTMSVDYLPLSKEALRASLIESESEPA
jgi:HAMP domain-containing protein